MDRVTTTSIPIFDQKMVHIFQQVGKRARKLLNMHNKNQHETKLKNK